MRRRVEARPACSRPEATKKDPEEKQHRQPEATRGRTYSSVLLNFGKCVLLLIIIPPFLNYASLQREEQMLLPQGGQVVDVGLGQKMHLLCKGRGKPVVVLDAPAGMSSDTWLHVQESVSSVTQVCTYDRVGLGFSKRAFPNETTGTEKVWGLSTTGRMVDDLQRLLRAANISMPFILVGSELGALNSRFYAHIHDVQVSDLVLIDPIPEEVFEEQQWNEYWYGKLLPSLHAQQLSAAAGLSRILIILGVLEPSIKGENVSEEVVQRQKYLLSNPVHQSSAVDEHYFMNESAAQVRDITKFKPLSSMISVSVLTGDLFDQQMPEHLNQMVAKLQTRFLKESYPSANHIHIKGADRRMIYKKPSAISQHLKRLVNQRQARQQSFQRTEDMVRDVKVEPQEGSWTFGVSLVL
uniref:Si:dkey-122a22.2 n=1 Tax=Oryzias latipes TaxID=8090 RepID=A0A3B3HHL8_ORYLA